MKLELTDRELEVLLELLEAAHRGRIHELHRTDASAYRRLLKERVQVIEDLISRLQRDRAAATPSR